MRKILAAAVLAALLFALGACGSDDDAAGHNDADVAFAQQMIPHHEQAVMMSEMAQARAERPQVKDLAADIKAAQGPEIETMRGWLESWDEDVPGGMSGMDHGDMDHGDMTGMMSEDQMNDLEGASGTEFDRMFLQMMIEHHEGAVEMARTEKSDGKAADVIALAEDIERTQTEEIRLMKSLLTS
ncbi:DUF305 domain-containing protein [Aeromicrobium flavum]|uniref:DUF305 domain-containing protein n=1 Tax=Aeromicrobium flavum TaxID=416568 RepID=UPI0031DAF449